MYGFNQNCDCFVLIFECWCKLVVLFLYLIKLYKMINIDNVLNKIIYKICLYILLCLKMCLVRIFSYEKGGQKKIYFGIFQIL